MEKKGKDGRKDVCLFLRSFFFLLVFFFLPFLVSAGVVINEVMYAPSDVWGGSVNEWVELYNQEDEPLNLSSCFLNEKELSGLIPGKGFVLVVRDKEKFKEIYYPLKPILEEVLLLENSFNHGLNNQGEKIVLSGENCQDSFDYSSFVPQAKGNNYTLERRADGSWGESLASGGTPGEENSIFYVYPDYESLIISEIMPDPFGKDDDLKPEGEWIELYNAGTKVVDLRGLYFMDKDSHKLYLTDHRLLAETGLILFPDEYVVVYRDGDKDFTLNNQGYEEVRLFYQDYLIDQVAYESSTEGMSWSNLEGDWYETPPTPGEINYYSEDCDWLLYLDLDNSIFQGDDFSFNLTVSRFYGFPQNITVLGKIEDFQGKTIKTYAPWVNELVKDDKHKKYSPNLPEGIYQISFWIENLECQDEDPVDNRVTKLVALNPTYQKFSSSLQIEKLFLGSDKVAHWGDQIRVKVNLYKGKETKTSLALWAEKEGEKISKTTRLNLYRQYQNYSLTLPLQLFPNCHQKIKDGQAVLVLEGWGLRAEKTFLIEGLNKDLCRDYLSYVKELKKEENKKKQKEQAYQLVDFPLSISPGEVFKIKVQLVGDDQEHEMKVWSYLYRGNKCRSCQGNKKREENQISFKLKKEEVRVVELLLRADDDLKEGLYKLKVKLNKDNQKTNKELTKDIYVVENKEQKKQQETKEKIKENLTFSTYAFLQSSSQQEGEGELLLKTIEKKKDFLEKSSGVVVYQSSSEKAKQTIFYFLLLTFGLLILLLLLEDFPLKKRIFRKSFFLRK